MIESAPDKESGMSFPGRTGEESLHKFPTPRNEARLNIGEIADRFKKAQENVVNEKMFRLFVRAVTEKEVIGSNDTLAFLQNRIIQECIDLSEQDVKLILNQFNRSVREWFSLNHKKSEIDLRVYDRIISGMYHHPGKENIDITNGIQNVITFLKARAILLGKTPIQPFQFYFSSKLDSKFSVDVIEERWENVQDKKQEPTISLIQLKSKEPTKEEKDKIYANHERWVKEEWFDFKKYENSYIENGTEVEISEFLRNKEKVEEALLEFCTDPEGQNMQKFMKSLHLSNLSNKQQAWILSKYIDLLNEQLVTATNDGALDIETKEKYAKELLNLREDLVRKTHLPKSHILVKNVKSVIAVGHQVVFEREIKIEESKKVMNVR